MSLPRIVQPEMMDDPALPATELRYALLGLSRLNRLSGVAGAMYRQLLPHAWAVKGRALRVLDIASGRGDLPIAWALMARRDRLAMQFTTLDINPHAIDEQHTAASAVGVELRGLEKDCLREPLPTGFDVVTCSLFMHHLEDLQASRLLQSMQGAAGRGLVICDLERTRLNLFLVGATAKAVSRSVVVHHDSVASVRGAYTRREFARLAESALLRPVICRRLFPCRFLLTIDDPVVPIPLPAFA